jgi:hypothetical protein
MSNKELEVQNGEIETKVELDVVPAEEIKAEDLKEEDISDEMIEEFTKSEGKTLKVPKKEKAAKVAKVEEKVADAKPAQEEKSVEQKEEKKINYGAFYEQKQKRIAAEQEAARLKAEIEELKNPKQKVPAYEEDPLENINQRLAQAEQERQQYQQQLMAQHQEQQFISHYANAAQEFEKTEPNFKAAYNHLIDSRYRELTAYGFSPEEANKTIADEEKWMVGAAFNKGQNPAAQLFNLAKMRGYNPNPAAPATPQLDNNRQKLENIERGQNLNKSVTGGKIAGQDLTEEVLSDIDSYNPFENIRGKTTLDVLFDNMAKNAR